MIAKFGAGKRIYECDIGHAKTYVARGTNEGWQHPNTNIILQVAVRRRKGPLYFFPGKAFGRKTMRPRAADFDRARIFPAWPLIAYRQRMAAHNASWGQGQKCNNGNVTSKGSQWCGKMSWLFFEPLSPHKQPISHGIKKFLLTWYDLWILDYDMTSVKHTPTRRLTVLLSRQKGSRPIRMKPLSVVRESFGTFVVFVFSPTRAPVHIHSLLAIFLIRSRSEIGPDSGWA